MRFATQGETSIKIFAAAIMVACVGYLGIHKGLVPGASLASVEADLKRAAVTALGEAGIDWAGITMRGQTAILSGTAPDQEAAERASRIVKDAVWAGGLVAGGITSVDQSRVRYAASLGQTRAIAAPFTWTATLAEDGSVSISGFVPDEQDRLALAATARRLFGQEADDRSIVARGAPEADWGRAAAAALAALAHLESGMVTASDTSFTVTGHAEDPAALTAAREQLTGFPRGLSAVERIEFDAPPEARP